GRSYLQASTFEHPGRAKDIPVGTIRIFVLGDKKPIAEYRNTVVSKHGWQGLGELGIEYSIHLIPKAKLLVVVPDSRDELHLYPADLDAALDNCGRDYLFFASTPPGRFRKGSVLSYQAEIRAKRGPVTVQLVSGPEGMTVDRNGLIQWAAPTKLDQERVDVILLAEDRAGQEAFQRFTLIAERAD